MNLAGVRYEMTTPQYLLLSVSACCGNVHPMRPHVGLYFNPHAIGWTGNRQEK